MAGGENKPKVEAVDIGQFVGAQEPPTKMVGVSLDDLLAESAQGMASNLAPPPPESFVGPLPEGEIGSGDPALAAAMMGPDGLQLPPGANDPEPWEDAGPQTRSIADQIPGDSPIWDQPLDQIENAAREAVLAMDEKGAEGSLSLLGLSLTGMIEEGINQAVETQDTPLLKDIALGEIALRGSRFFEHMVGGAVAKQPIVRGLALLAGLGAAGGIGGATNMAWGEAESRIMKGKERPDDKVWDDVIEGAVKGSAYTAFGKLLGKTFGLTGSASEELKDNMERAFVRYLQVPKGKADDPFMKGLRGIINDYFFDGAIARVKNSAIGKVLTGAGKGAALEAELTTLRDASAKSVMSLHDQMTDIYTRAVNVVVRKVDQAIGKTARGFKPAYSQFVRYIEDPATYAKRRFGNSQEDQNAFLREVDGFKNYWNSLIPNMGAAKASQETKLLAYRRMGDWEKEVIPVKQEAARFVGLSMKNTIEDGWARYIGDKGLNAVKEVNSMLSNYLETRPAIQSFVQKTRTDPDIWTRVKAGTLSGEPLFNMIATGGILKGLGFTLPSDRISSSVAGVGAGLAGLATSALRNSPGGQLMTAQLAKYQSRLSDTLRIPRLSQKVFNDPDVVGDLSRTLMEAGVLVATGTSDPRKAFSELPDEDKDAVLAKAASTPMTAHLFEDVPQDGLGQGVRSLVNGRVVDDMDKALVQQRIEQMDIGPAAKAKAIFELRTQGKLPTVQAPQKASQSRASNPKPSAAKLSDIAGNARKHDSALAKAGTISGAMEYGREYKNE